jgi:hypothetical protein
MMGQSIFPPGEHPMRRQSPAALLLTLLYALPVAAPALAKLPPPSPEQKAAADEAAARNAWNDKVGAYQLCKADDKVAEKYRADAKAAGKNTLPAIPTPPCTDPGPYVSPVTLAANKPLEASGAHSPAGTAHGPPSTPETQAGIGKQKK